MNNLFIFVILSLTCFQFGKAFAKWLGDIYIVSAKYDAILGCVGIITLIFWAFP